MKSIKEIGAKFIEGAQNEDYTTVLVRKTNGNYMVLTKGNGKSEYNSFARSFRTLEEAKKHFDNLAE